MMRVILATIVASAMLISCGGNGGKKTVENPYLERAHGFSADGMEAMRRERWSSAERAFSRALLAAQLSDDTGLVRLSWYNLGVVRSAMGHLETAEEAFRRCMSLAKRQGDEVMRVRSQLALALMRVRHHQKAGAVVVANMSLPADVHLQRARLAQLQGDSETADQAYHSAITKSGQSANGLRMKADALMGLAILQHDAGNDEQARKFVEQALEICREIGAPRLTAHALFLSGRIAVSVDSQRDYFERALAIYTALNDMRGQREALEQLQKLAETSGDSQYLERIQLRLQGLALKTSALLPTESVGP